MKAFVTGANGFSAAHLIKALEQRGDAVVGLVRKSSNLSRLDGCNVELVYADLCDVDALKAAMTGVDVVFHVAAYVELGIVKAAEMERVNVDGTRAVLAAAQAAGVPRMVYCSTIGIFGDTQGRVIDETLSGLRQIFRRRTIAPSTTRNNWLIRRRRMASMSLASYRQGFLVPMTRILVLSCSSFSKVG